MICAGCGIRVRYFPELRNSIMDHVAVLTAVEVRVSVLGVRTAKGFEERGAMDCDVMRRAMAISVLNEIDD